MSAARYLFKAPSLRGAPVLQGGIRLPGRTASCPCGGFSPPTRGWAMPPYPGGGCSPLCGHLSPCPAPVIERDGGHRLPDTPAVTLTQRARFGLAIAVARFLGGDRDVWLGRRFQGNPG